MSYCSADVLSGIVTLKGSLSIPDLETIYVKNSPITLSIAPRTTTPTMVGNKIEDSYESTVLYKGTKYGMAHVVQVCAPLHTGYPIPGNNLPVGELVIAFSNTKITGSYPTGILLCVPIYESSIESHAAYLNQFVVQDSPVASLQTVFYETDTDESQKSMGYQTCFETINTATNTSSNYNLLVLVYTEGIQLTLKNFQILVAKISGKGNTLPTFQLPSGLRNGNPTVSSFTFDSSGNKVQKTISTTGELYTTQLSVGTTDFMNRFEFYPSPKLASRSSSMFKASCPYYKSTQYKCVPFDRIRNMEGELVIPEGTMLSKILTKQDNTVSAGSVQTSGGISIGAIETGIAVLGGTILAGVLAFTIGHYVVKLSED